MFDSRMNRREFVGLTVQVLPAEFLALTCRHEPAENHKDGRRTDP